MRFLPLCLSVAVTVVVALETSLWAGLVVFALASALEGLHLRELATIRHREREELRKEFEARLERADKATDNLREAVLGG